MVHSIPGLGRYPEKRKGYPLQYSGLENSMDCVVHGVTKSWTQVSNFHFHFQLLHEINILTFIVYFPSTNKIIFPPMIYTCLLILKVEKSSFDAGVQPRLIQGIRSGDGVGDLFNYLFIKDIKSNKMRIAQ